MSPARIESSVTRRLKNDMTDCMFVRLSANNHACFFVMATFVCIAQKPATDGNEVPVKTESKNTQGEPLNAVMQTLKMHARPSETSQTLHLALTGLDKEEEKFLWACQSNTDFNRAAKTGHRHTRLYKAQPHLCIFYFLHINRQCF